MYIFAVKSKDIFMAKGRLSEDDIRLTVAVESSKAQQDIRKIEKESASLREENDKRMKQMLKLEAAGKKESDAYKNLRKEYSDTGKRIRENTNSIAELTKKINVNHLTMAQLSREAKQLQKQMDHTAKSLEPEAYKQLEERLRTVQGRMKELKDEAKSFKDRMSENGASGFLWGTSIVKMSELGFKTLTALGGKIEETVMESIAMAEGAEGVELAFQRLDRPDLLDGLRKATHGTVTDFELMKQAVRFQDFNLSVEELGTMLAFAQQKAKDTGQSIDYMVDSIVTGLGRKSLMILDNLGLSAADVKAKMAETGDMTTAVGAIIREQMAKAGGYVETAAERAARANVELQNAQLALGKQLLPLKESVSTFYTSMQTGIIKTISAVIRHKGEILSFIKVMSVYAAAYALLYTWQQRQLIITSLITAKEVALNAARKAGIALMGTYRVAVALLTGNITKATVAIRAMRMAMMTNPYTALITVVLSLGVAIYGLVSKFSKGESAIKKNTEALRRQQQELRNIKQIEEEANRTAAERVSKINQLRKTVEDSNEAYSKRKTALEELRRIVPDYHGHLSKEKGLYDSNTEAIDKYIKKVKDAAIAQAAMSKMTEITSKMMDAEMELAKKEKEAADLESQINSPNYSTADPGMIELEKNDLKLRLAVIQAFINQARNAKAEADAQLNSISDYLKDKGIDPSASMPTTGDGGYNDDSEVSKRDQQTLDNFKRARQAELDAETTFFSERERQYKESLARQEITRQQYDTAMTAEQAAHAKRVLDIEKDYSKQSAQLQLTDAKKKKEIVADQQRNAEKAEQQYLNQLTKIYEQGQQAMQQLTDQGMTPQEREQRNRELQLQVLRSYYESALMMAQQYGQDEQAVTEAYLKARMRLLQQQVEAEQQRRQKEATERQRTREQLGVEQQTEYEQRHQQLVEALEKGYVTQEEYADREKQLKMDSWKEQFDYYAQLFGGAINALQDAEMANVDAKYDAEIEAARKAGKDTTELENKKAEEKLEIQKKYADVNFAVKASQIIADTAVSIMKALAELGPIAGPVAAALMGITGAAQLAAANAERQKVKNMTLGGASSSSTQAGGARVATGRAEGGYVDVEREQDGRRFHARMEPGRRGYVDRPTVIVGEGPRSKEWVASNDAVENPTVRPFIDVLDRMQRSGQVRTFDLRKYLQQEQTRGLAAGGSVNVSQTKDSTPTVTGSDTVTKRLADVLERIERDGIPAIVGVDQVEASQKQRDRARKIGSKQ